MSTRRANLPAYLVRAAIMVLWMYADDSRVSRTIVPSPAKGEGWHRQALRLSARHLYCPSSSNSSLLPSPWSMKQLHQPSNRNRLRVQTRNSQSTSFSEFTIHATPSTLTFDSRKTWLNLPIALGTVISGHSGKWLFMMRKHYRDKI